LGGASFLEFLLNIFVLFLIGVFLVNYLQSKGWWQAYCQPPIDKVTKIVYPFYSKVADFTSPVVVPVLTPIFWIWKWLSDKLTVDIVQPPPPKKRGRRHQQADPEDDEF